jgi:hypothetical protein
MQIVESSADPKIRIYGRTLCIVSYESLANNAIFSSRVSGPKNMLPSKLNAAMVDERLSNMK